MLVELEQLLDLVALLRLHLFENRVGLFLGQLGQQVSGCARVHLLDNVGDLFFVELFEQRLLQLWFDFLQRLGGHFFIERSEDRLSLGRSQVFEDLGQVGGVHLGQPFVLDAQLHPTRRVDFDDVDKLPGNAAGAQLARDRFQRGPRQNAFEYRAGRRRESLSRPRPRAAGERRRGPATPGRHR